VNRLASGVASRSVLVLSAYMAANTSPQGTTKSRCAWTVGGVQFHCPSNYQPLDTTRAIGTGAYAVVASACDTQTNTKVAIKRVHKVLKPQSDARGAIEAKRMLREILLLRAMDHPNIINVMHMWYNGKDVYLVEPLMEADLHKVIRSPQKLTDEHFQFFTCQILRGLKYMHSANVIHRDLKPANILVNSDCDVKICDFGLARAVEEDSLHKTMYVVTRWYRAPELMIADDYTEAVDMWAVGCILAEFLGRKALFPGKSTLHQLELITDVLGSMSDADLSAVKRRDETATRLVKTMQAKQNSKPIGFAKRYDKATPKAISLLESLLLYRASDRLSATAALEHPWLEEHHDPALEPSAPGRLDFDFEHLGGQSAQAMCKLIYDNAEELTGETDPAACQRTSGVVKLPEIGNRRNAKQPAPQPLLPRPAPVSAAAPAEENLTASSSVAPGTPKCTIGPQDVFEITAYNAAPEPETEANSMKVTEASSAEPSEPAKPSDRPPRIETQNSQNKSNCSCNCVAQ